MYLKDKYLLTFLCIVISIFIGFNPIIGGDTGGYTQVVINIANANLTGYDFARTIGYPIFIFIISGLFGNDINTYPSLLMSIAITYAQMLIYLYSTYIFYKIIKINNLNFSIIFLTINIPFILYTKFILPESITYSIFLLLVCKIITNPNNLWFLSLLIVAIKPNYFPIVLLIILYYDKCNYSKIKFFTSILIMCLFTWVNTNSFNITNISGLAKSQIVYNLFDKVPKEHKILGDIMSNQYKSELVNGTLRADIWTRCADALRENIYQMPFEKSSEEWKNGTVNLSIYVGKVSNDLILNNPLIVIKNIAFTAKSVINFEFPIIQYQIAADPRSIDGLNIIKYKISNYIYNFFRVITSKIFIYSFYFISLLLILNKKYRNEKIIIPYLIIIINFLIISVFGVIDSRYNLVCSPLLFLVGYNLIISKGIKI